MKNLLLSLSGKRFGIAWLLFTLGLFLSPIAQASEGTLPETRGIWLDTRSLPGNEMALDLIVDRLYQANFNAIFVESFYNGETIYPSPYLESLGMNRQMGGFPDGDPLQWLITSAHRRGMQVHAWLHLFYVGLNEPGPVLSAHPEWASVNRDGTSGYQLGNNRFFWVCPTQPGVVDFYQGLAAELISRYPVDGIQLDYVRFPDPMRSDAGYSETARRYFTDQYGIDPVTLDPDFHPQAFAQWNRYRADRVSEVVAGIAQAVRAISPEVIVSASVMPRGMPLALNPSYLQDWPRWAEAGHLDVVIPMTYSSRVNEMRGLLVWVNHFLRGSVPYYAGIQLFRVIHEEDPAAQVSAARSLGSSGEVLFAWPHLTDPLLRVLTRGPFADPATPARHTDLLARRSPYSDQPVSYHHESPRRIIAQFWPEPPILAASFAEPPWHDLSWQGEFSLITGEGLAAKQTRVTAAYTSDTLYVAFQAEDEPSELVEPTITERDGPVFYEDSVEAFIDPGQTWSFYYHLVANTLGTQYDSFSRTGPAWSGNWQVITETSENGWSALFAIPFAELGRETPSPGEIWGINFNRNTIRLDEFSGWSYTPGTFHAPTFFGDIEFTGNPGQ